MNRLKRVKTTASERAQTTKQFLFLQSRCKERMRFDVKETEVWFCVVAVSHILMCEMINRGITIMSMKGKTRKRRRSDEITLCRRILGIWDAKYLSPAHNKLWESKARGVTSKFRNEEGNRIKLEDVRGGEGITWGHSVKGKGGLM